MHKSYPIGIIAEDESDVECIKHFINKISPNKQFAYKKFTGEGCGKIKRKANSWASILKQKGCKFLVVVHDLDRHKKDDLILKIKNSLIPCPIKNYFISVPIEELESRLLADKLNIKKIFHIKDNVNVPHKPESVQSPKEYMSRLVRTKSEKKIYYLNTKHNPKIAETIDITHIAAKCPSFAELQHFIQSIK